MLNHSEDIGKKEQVLSVLFKVPLAPQITLNQGNSVRDSVSSEDFNDFLDTADISNSVEISDAEVK